jgi:hypothetical protein
MAKEFSNTELDKKQIEKQKTKDLKKARKSAAKAVKYQQKYGG